MGIRPENFEGMPGRNEKKPERRIPPQTEDTAKGSLFFFSARTEEAVGVMGDRRELMIFMALISVTGHGPTDLSPVGTAQH